MYWISEHNEFSSLSANSSGLKSFHQKKDRGQSETNYTGFIDQVHTQDELVKQSAQMFVQGIGGKRTGYIQI